MANLSFLVFSPVWYFLEQVSWFHEDTNHRLVEETLREMREISLRICEATTEGVLKRKSRETKDLRLS
jgi:hypothetical protein